VNKKKLMSTWSWGTYSNLKGSME